MLRGRAGRRDSNRRRQNRRDQPRRTAKFSNHAGLNRNTLPLGSQSGRGLSRNLLRAGLGVVIVGVVAWLALFGWISNVDSAQPELQELAEQRLADSSRLRVLSGAIDLEQYLLARLPHYQSVDVTQGIFNRTIEVDGQLKQPAVYWRSAGRNYSVSADGFVIARVDDLPKSTIVVDDQSDLNYQPGVRVATSELVAFIDRVSTQELFSVESLQLSNSRTLLVGLSDQRFELRLSSSIQPNAQLRSAQQLLEQGSQPVSYIDSTIPGRLFWQ